MLLLLGLGSADLGKSIVGVGLGVWVLANLGFGVYYAVKMSQDVGIRLQLEKMSGRSRCVYYAVVALSVALTLRTYRVLYCGLFRGVAPYQVRRVYDTTNKITNNKVTTNRNTKGKVANSNNPNDIKDMNSGRTKNKNDLDADGDRDGDGDGGNIEGSSNMSSEQAHKQ